MKILSYFVAFAMIAASGCATKKPTAGQVSQFKIANVTAAMAPNVGARTDIASKVTRHGRNTAAQYNSRNSTARSTRTIDIVVNSVRYKSALASALVGGSGNQITGTTYVGNRSGQRGPGIPIEYWDRASSAANGIFGVVVAVAGATGGKDRVDERLAKGLAESAIEAAYTQKTPKQFGIAPPAGLAYKVGSKDKKISYALDQPTSRRKYSTANRTAKNTPTRAVKPGRRNGRRSPTPPPPQTTF